MSCFWTQALPGAVLALDLSAEVIYIKHTLAPTHQVTASPNAT